MQDKELVKAIKVYILEDVDREETLDELRRYRNEFPYETDYNWYKYGNILPYYSQIRDFYERNGIVPPEDCAELQEHFERHIRTAIDELLKENGCNNVKR